VEIDSTTMRAVHPLPTCPNCGALTRPNILMFGDWGWHSSRTEAQMRRLTSWIDSLGDAPVVVVECGAGGAVPTVRNTCERIADHVGGTLIRINTHEPDVPNGHLSLSSGALDALRALDAKLSGQVVEGQSE
jgi:NAD-dependent SIR2 family protein deacetylase